MFAPITQALISDARIVSGNTVLDVATGPGEPALSIAEIVGPAGAVWGVDQAPEMVAAAQRVAAQLGLKNGRFQAGLADHLPFESDTFDAVVSRFGVMFFPSPAAGLREILRVLKPGRRIAVAVWHFADRNPFHYVLSRVVDQFVESQPAPPDSPDAFRFAPRGKLLEIFREAGALDSSERLLQFSIEAPLSPEDFWKLRLDMSDKLRSKLRLLSMDKRNEIEKLVIEGLREYSTPNGISCPAEVLIISGTK
jgi:SAM-dependent methyltransferase